MAETKKGEQPPQPLLAQCHRDRLKQSIILLDGEMQGVVEAEIDRHCLHRGWHVWARNARSNHVHVVVTSVGISGKIARDQLKANCTRGLRERWAIFQARPIWTVGGDWKCINNDDDLATVVEYVLESQDRKHLDRG